MDDEIIQLKELFYDNLLELIRKDRKLYNKSIILSFLRMTSNNILVYLDKASVAGYDIPQELIQKLLLKDLIRGGQNFSQYIITAKGVWEIENYLGNININSLIDEIDKYKFEIKKGEELNNQDKVVTITLIALRAFYQKTPLNRNNEYALNDMLAALNESKDSLEEARIISKFEFTKPSKEDSVEALFRRSNELKKRTRSIYCFGGKKHWLDIYDEKSDTISLERLGYLLWKIFGGDLSFDEQNKISVFCDRLLNRYKNYIYNEEERQGFVFSNIAHKSAIKDALFGIIENRDKWAELDDENL